MCDDEDAIKSNQCRLENSVPSRSTSGGNSVSVFAIPIRSSEFLGLLGIEDALLMMVVADNVRNVRQKSKNDSLIG